MSTEIDCETVAKQLWGYISDKKCEPTISQLNEWMNDDRTDDTTHMIKGILDKNEDIFVQFTTNGEDRVLLR